MAFALTTRTSDVKQHASCARSWYYRARVEVATRTGAAAQKGTVGHADVERWMQTSTEPVSKAGRLLVEGLKRIAEYPGLQVLGPGCAGKRDWNGDIEWHWTEEVMFPMAKTVVTYHGTADLVLWATEADGGLAPMVPVIIDHKTRGQLDWAPDADALAEDWQAAAYSAAVMRKTGAKAVYFLHNNICERDGTSRVVGVRMDLEHANRIWKARVLGEVEKMLVHADAERAEDVPGDVTGAACSQFGGCPYKNRCTQWTRLVSPRHPEEPMALIGKPAAPSATTATPAPTPAPTTPAAQVVAPPPAAVTAAPVAHDPETGEVPGGYHLYVNCAPLPRQGQAPDLVTLDQVLAEMTAHVCHKRGVDHYSQVKYGEAKADIMALLAVNLPPAGRHVVLDTADELQRDALTVLLPHAATVVRGWK